MNSEPRTELADYVRALTEPIQHAENYVLRAPYPGGGPTAEVRVHRTLHASLLDQLATAVEPSSATQAGARGYESSPAARLDAIDMLRKIDRAASGWLVVLHVTVRTTTADNLRALVGAVPDDQATAAAKAAKRWVTWARIVTGWDVPAWRPNAPCPACDVRGSLRVRVDPMSAMCIEEGCETTWNEDDGGIAILAEYIRWINGEGADTGELQKVT